MKKLFVLLLGLFLLPLISFTQILDPIKWAYRIEQSNPGEATLLMTARIDKKWHLYSQDIHKDKEGPNPTTFSFIKSKDYQLVGKVVEPKPIEENDPMFKMIIKYFTDKAVFKQKIRILSAKPFSIKGSIDFMTCDDTQCIYPPVADRYSQCIERRGYSQCFY